MVKKIVNPVISNDIINITFFANFSGKRSITFNAKVPREVVLFVN